MIQFYYHLNTSNVTVNQELIMKDLILDLNLNTSNVTVNPIHHLLAILNS